LFCVVLLFQGTRTFGELCLDTGCLPPPDRLDSDVMHNKGCDFWKDHKADLPEAERRQGSTEE
jgi:hypothetical protein